MLRPFNLFLLLLLATYTFDSATSDPVLVHGHLIYQSAKETPTIVNPKILKFYKQFDLTYIAQSIEALFSFQNAYKGYCNKMSPSIVDRPPHFSHSKTYDDQIIACKNHAANLYEIRSPQEAQHLKKYMLERNTYEVYANLYLDDFGTVRYQTDNEPNMWPYHRRCTDCAAEASLPLAIYQEYKKRYGNTMHFRYTLVNNASIVITTINHKTEAPCPIIPAFCTPFKKEASLLQQFIALSCQKDVLEIKKMNEMLLIELKQIQNPGRRTKRAIGLIAAGFLGLDALINSVGGTSPLSGLGKGIAYTLGIATHADLEVTRQTLELQATQLKNISINQIALIEAYSEVNREIEKLTRMAVHMTHELTILYSDLNNKIAVYRLQQLVQNSIIKMTASVQAAKNQMTSPYVFGNQDIAELSAQFRLHAVPLTNEIDDVISSVMLIENTYTFIIAVPVIKTEESFYFYEVSALPVFREQKGFRVHFKNNFIAVNAARQEYALVSATEYAACTSYSMCTLTQAMERLDSKAPCEVRSLRTQTNQCTAYPDDEVRPTFFTFGNTSYYSIPNPMEIHLNCKSDQKSFDKSYEISFHGHFFIPEGCQATIDHETHIRPGFVVSNHVIDTPNFLNVLIDANVTLQIPPPPPLPMNITVKTPKTWSDVSSVGETLGVVFDFETTTAEVIRILAYIIVVFTVIGLCACASPKFRLWLKTCTLTTKPSKYWSQVRGYHTPAYVRRDKIDIEAQKNNFYPATTNTNIEAMHRRLMNFARIRPNPAVTNLLPESNTIPVELKVLRTDNDLEQKYSTLRERTNIFPEQTLEHPPIFKIEKEIKEGHSPLVRRKERIEINLEPRSSLIEKERIEYLEQENSPLKRERNDSEPVYSTIKRKSRLLENDQIPQVHAKPVAPPRPPPLQRSLTLPPIASQFQSMHYLFDPDRIQAARQAPVNPQLSTSEAEIARENILRM